MQTRFELPKTKVENGYFLTSKNSEKFKSDRFDEREQLCPLAQLPVWSRIGIINSTIYWDLELV
jgi:hypothetical protein